MNLDEDEFLIDDEDFALEAQKKKKKKSTKTGGTRRARSKPASVVCLPCRISKRKCDGKIPCRRCIDQNKVDKCVQVIPKKRGRKRKSEEAIAKGAPENAILALGPGFDLQDLRLGEQQSLILKMMLAYGDKALEERPRDIGKSFGLDMSSGFIALRYAGDRFKDPVEAFMQSQVVSAGPSHNPKNPDIVGDPNLLVGKTIQQLTSDLSHTPTNVENIKKVLETPAPARGRPWIRRYRTSKEIKTDQGAVAKIVVENTVFMNEAGAPQWMFVSIADRQRGDEGINTKMLKSNLFEAGSSFAQAAAPAPPPPTLVASKVVTPVGIFSDKQFTFCDDGDRHDTHKLSFSYTAPADEPALVIENQVLDENSFESSSMIFGSAPQLMMVEDPWSPMETKTNQTQLGRDLVSGL